MAQDTHKKYKVVASYEIVATDAEMLELKRALLRLEGLLNIELLHANVESEKVMQADAPTPGKYNATNNLHKINDKPRKRVVKESMQDLHAGKHKPEIDAIVAEIALVLHVPESTVRSMARSQAKLDNTTLFSALMRQRLRLPPRDELLPPTTPPVPEMTFMGIYCESHNKDLISDTDLHVIPILRYSRDYGTITLPSGAEYTVCSGFVSYNGHDYWFPTEVDA